MSKITVSTSRTQLWTTTALVAVSNAMALRRAPRWPLVASTVIALAGTGLISMPSQAFAQDIDLGLSGDIYDIRAIGNQDIDSLSGVAGTEVLLGANTLTLNQTISTLYRGVISGSGSLIKNGTGMLTLTGANTYTGDTVINGGAVQIGNGGTTGSVAGNIVNNAQLTFDRSNDLSYGGVISGSGSLSKYGAGILTLNGANTYTGDTNINAGTLAIGIGGSLSSNSRVSLSNAAKFDISAANAPQSIGNLSGAGSSEVLLGANTLTVNQTIISFFNGVISGSGSLIKNGTGILILEGANTYTGDTVINAGTLQIGSVGTTGSVAGNILNNAQLTFNRNNDLSYGGEISGSGSLSKYGAGILTLNGANTYTGDTVISEGTLAIGIGGSLSSYSRVTLNNAAKFDISAANAPQSIGSLSGSVGAEVLLGANTLTINQKIGALYGGVISGSGSLIKNGTNILTLNGANTYTGDTVINGGGVQIGTGGTTGSVAGNIVNNAQLSFYRSNDLSYGGVIRGSGNLYKEGAGTLTLTGVNTYTGVTTINAGGLALKGNGSLASSGDVSLNNAGATFNISGAAGDRAIGTLSGVTGTTVTLGANTLTTNASANTTYAGEITGTGGFTKNGAGTLTLTGSNTYTGTTTINAGTLQLGFGNGAGSVFGDIVNNAKLVFSSSGDRGFSRTISGTGSLEKEGFGTLILMGNNTYSGGTKISGGALQIGIGGTSGSVLGDIVNNTRLVFNRSDNSSYAGQISGTGSFDKIGTGTLTLTGTNTYSGDTSISGTLAMGATGQLVTSGSMYIRSGATFDISLATLAQTIGALGGDNGSSVVLGAQNLITDSYRNSTFYGTISGTGNLTKNGGSTLTLVGDNTYTGTTTISDGLLQIGDGGTKGSLTGNIVNNARLLFNRSDDSSYGGRISGTGSFDLSGGGTLTLTGAHSYSGSTYINSGKLVLGALGQLQTTGLVNLGQGATFDISQSTLQQSIGALEGAAGSSVVLGSNNLTTNTTGSATYAGVISGGGNLTKAGAGTLTLTGANTYRGFTTITSGTLALGAGGALSNSILLTLGSGTTFDISAAGNQSIGNLSGSINSSVVLGENNLSLGNNGISTFQGNISGSGSLTKTGSGRLTLTQANTYTGQTLIENGILQLSGDGSLSASSHVNLSGFGSALYVFTASGQTIGSLSGVAGSFVQLDRSLTVGGDNTDTTFAGELVNVVGGAIIKSGTGTMTLTGGTQDAPHAKVSGGTLVMAGQWDGTAEVRGGTLQFGQTASQNPAYAPRNHTLSGNLDVSGAGSTLSITGSDTLTVAIQVHLMNGTNLSIHAGASGPSLSADAVVFGTGTTFNLSGISDTSALPKVLIQTTNGILGDFANVNIGGAAGAVDYMSITAGLSDDRTQLLAKYGLSWTAGYGQSHGTFTLSGATDNFNLDVALGDQVANADWDGKSLTKAGAGTLILSKDNTYTGGTTITGGTLQLGNGGTTGSVLGDIANSGVLAINRSDAFNLANTVFGTGSLVQAGSGTLILTGANTYSGGTTINAGTLQLGNGGITGSITGNIVNNASLAINRSDNLSLSNTISGTGNLIKDGANTLTLTGTNTYSGGTVIENGTLSVSQDTNLGQADGALSFKGGGLQITGTGFASTNRNMTLDINTGGLDIVEAGHSFTVNGNIAGPGNVLKRGAGTLVLTGQNRFGRLRIENGKVVANSASLGNTADLAFASSTLSLSDTGNGLYAGTITGAGKLSLDGSGTVLLTGNSSTFNGTTTLNSGRLLVGNSAGQGSLGGAFNVLSGATLGGSGTIGSGSTVTIASGGTLSPGNSIGTLNVYGHLDLQAGSLLNMELGRPGALQNTPGTSDRVNVAGDLTLNGTLNLTQSGNAADGDFSFGYYRLMTYGGTLSGNGLTIGQSPALAGGASPQIIAGNGNVDLFIAGIGDAALQHWQGGDGVWSASNSQWLNQNGNTAANWAGNHAVFRNPDAATSGGTITLVGAQSFKGLQFVDNGYRLEGTGSLVTDSAGSEIRVLADSATIAATITGTGGLTKTQGGTLILTGTNTYSGGTTIKDGVISVTQNANLGAANGALEFDGGALQINGTALGSMDRNITLGTNGGAVDLVAANHSLTLNGTITGEGTLLKQGAGTLVLTGQNSFGGISIEEGKLVAQTASLANQVDLANASTVLSLTDTGNSHYAGILSGTGQFNMDGKGTVLLTGDSSAFGGTTTLNSGTLLVGDSSGQGALGGSFNVLNGATLGGSGTIGSGTGSLVTIASGATLSPGNSIGTLSINGDLLIQKGARFVVEVTPGGSTSDLVRVSGTATLGGGTVAHIGANGNYDLRSTYTILSATSLSGTFDAVTSDFAFLTPTLTYDNTRVTLDLKRNDLEFASAAQGRNQVRTARAIESIGFNTGHAVYDAIAQMADDKTAIRSAFDQLSGELHTSARAIQIEDSRFVRHAANDRLRSAFGQAGSSDAPVLAYAANGSQVAVDATYDGAAFWAQSFGSWGSFDNDANSIELERQIGGALLGGDVRLKDWRLGLIAGYSQSEVKAERQKATSDNTTLGVYAGGQWGKLALRAGLAQSWHDIETQRSVLFTGLSDYLQAEYSATTRQAFVETGYALVSREEQQLEAFANLAQVRASSDAFSEDGDAAALDMAQTDADVTFATLGLRAARQIAMGETSGTLRASAGWRYASGDTATQNLQAFSAGDAFTITGAPIAKNAAVIETGLDVRFDANTTFGLTYTGQFSNSAQDHGFNARLSINF